MSATDWVVITRSQNTLNIAFKGAYRSRNARYIDPLIRDIRIDDLKQANLDLSQITSFDTTGAWLIERFVKHLCSKDIKVNLDNLPAELETIFEQIRKFKFDQKSFSEKIPPLLLWLEGVGRTTQKIILNAYHMLEFFGQFVFTMVKSTYKPKQIKVVSVVAILNRVGLNALPIVGTISFLIGIVLVYQGSYQLQKFGAEIFTVDLLAVSFLREIGILLTAIVVAGRSGSAFAAQIGTMKLNQEIDALNTFGLDPMEILVLPRVIALVIAMPLLAFYSDMVGLFGGAMMSMVALDISYNQFFAQLNQAVNNWTFWIGMIKAPVFGFAIALIGCFEGMQVEGGAQSVGRKTTKSVVEAIFVVIALDAIFSVMFTMIGI